MQSYNKNLYFARSYRNFSDFLLILSLASVYMVYAPHKLEKFV